MEPKYNDYRILRPSGEVERCRIPRFVSPRSIADQLRHSEVFVRVPKGWSILCADSMAHGPCWVWHGRDGRILGPVAEPTDESVANAELKRIGAA